MAEEQNDLPVGGFCKIMVLEEGSILMIKPTKLLKDLAC
jgi:hypothetical protein